MRVQRRLRANPLRLAIGGLILVCTLAAVLLIARWPFTRSKAIESFERISSCDVRISDFRKIFLPHPGYIAQNVTFARGGSGNQPIATIRKITCRATWLALVTFTHRITSMDLEGLKIEIPAHLPPPIRKHTEAETKTTVTRLVANGTVLEIAPREHVLRSLRFDFPGLVLGNVGKDKSITIQADVQNPNPPADLRVDGSVGPLLLGKIAQTPISGVFHLMHANLGAYKLINGDLTSAGRFEGTLGRSEVHGDAEIPNFEVTSSHHSVGLTTEYRAVVDGRTGDVAIESAQTHFLGTTLVVQGSISGQEGKTVSLDFEDRTARIQDLLRIFVTADHPPLNGTISLQGHIVLPSSHQSFLHRVQLDGQFAIKDANFTNTTRQDEVDVLSARALGKKSEIKRKNAPPRVTETLMGNVRLRAAVATVSHAVFDVPGAVVTGGGKYDLSSEAIDLRGVLAMHASLSKAVGGLKSIFLIPRIHFLDKTGRARYFVSASRGRIRIRCSRYCLRTRNRMPYKGPGIRNWYGNGGFASKENLQEME